MKKVDLKRVVEKEWVGHLMRCDSCGASYVIEEGDRIEVRRYEKICHETWAIGPVLECECGESTIQKDDLEKWDGYEVKEVAEKLKKLTSETVCHWIGAKIQNMEAIHSVSSFSKPFGENDYHIEIRISPENAKRVYQAFGGKL